MNLHEITEAMEAAMKAQPGPGYVVREDVFRLNSDPAALYPAFAWQQGTHVMDGDFVDYSFTLFYVERLAKDLGNEVLAQSAGLEALSNVVRTLRARGLYVSGVQFDAFKQKFADECAGMICRCTVAAPVDTTCAASFA